MNQKSENDSSRPADISSATLFDRFPDGLLAAAANGTIRRANCAAAAMLGYSLDELTGMNLRDLCGKDMAAALDKLTMASANPVCPAPVEVMIRDCNGHRNPVELRLIPLNASEHDEAGMLLLIRDAYPLIERTHNQIKLNRLAAIGEFASCVAHDISNPLSVVKLYGEWLAADLEGNAEPTPEIMDNIREGMDNIQKSADRIEQLITQLRTFSRNSCEPSVIIDLRDAVEQAVLVVREKLRETGILVEQHIPDYPCLVRTQGNQLQQVFVNLLENALDAVTNTASPRLEITVQKQSANVPDAEFVYICHVTDNGIGMTSEMRDMAFKAFHTAHEDEGKAGLGLAIVRNIVRRHGGEVHLESEPNAGTTVSITLTANVERDENIGLNH
jgi:two-component system NtrC family sensor kinase